MCQNSLFIVSQGNKYFAETVGVFIFLLALFSSCPFLPLSHFFVFPHSFHGHLEVFPSWCNKLIHFVLFVPSKIARPRLLCPAINLSLPLSRLRSRVAQQIAPIYVHHSQCKAVVSVGEDDIIQLCLLCFPSSRGLFVVLLTLAELRSFI